MTNLTFPRSAFIGFDHMFDELNSIITHSNDHYPPYNIVRDGKDNIDVEIALAGFSKDDIDIEVKDRVLTIKGSRERRREDDRFIHRGISAKKFVKSFRLGEYTEVSEAEMTDGILVVRLENIVPEERRPKSIAIK